ncbi:unnamed protein product [Linum tenue]|uniref:Uncharacterized protein n=1 Tax=Linum tenue TaxID=586396 RepID=A0AAV0JAP4_9ROSI|nr:unnamed protein product [Linum tenue]
MILYQNWLVCNTRPTARLKFEITKLDAKPAPTVTEFSSRGPSPTFPSVLKPDIMGPGFRILTTWPVHVQDLYTSFNLLTGTSMACPHLDGVATLIKKAHPDWSPAAIRSAMMTTSDAVDHSGQPIQDSGPDQSPTTGFDMGAGQVSPNKALEPGLVYDLNSSDYVNLLCAMNFTTAQIRAITRSHHSTGSCNNICATPSLDLNYPSFIANFAADRSNQVLEFRRTLTNVGCEMATYKASVTSFDGLEVRVVPTVLAFKAKGDMLGFKLVIEYAMKKMRNPFLKLGYLRWIEVGGGNHVVQSPIVATNMNSL